MLQRLFCSSACKKRLNNHSLAPSFSLKSNKYQSETHSGETAFGKTDTEACFK